MPICPNGHEVDADVAFCRQCGASLTPLTQVQPLLTAAPRQTSPSNTAVYVLAGVIVLVGLVAIGIALVVGSGGGTAPQTSPSSPQATATSSSPSNGQSPSASPTGPALPAGGTRCPGTNAAGGTYGTIGTDTSCGFAQAVDASYVDAGGATTPSGQTRRVTATSPATGVRYTNILCTSGDQWVTCVGGKDNTAHLFFSHP